MRRKPLACLFAVLLGLGCGDAIQLAPSGLPSADAELGRSSNTTPDECPEIADPDAKELQGWLQAGDYASLEALFAAHFRAYQQNVLCEEALYRAHTALAYTGDEWLAKLRAWQEHSPEDPAPYTVLTRALRQAGYNARGQKLSKDTPAENFRRMHERFAEGMEAARKAIALEPTHPVPYSETFQMLRAMGGQEQVAETLQALLALDPRPFSPRIHAIYANQPRWGGSLEEMERIAQEAQAHVGENRRLKILPGAVLAYRAIHQTRDRNGKKDLDAAIALYTQALAYGDHGSAWTLERARLYISKNQLDEAMGDLERVLSITPRDAEAYRERARVHMAREDWPKALADLARADELWPGNLWTLHQRASVEERMGRTEEALAHYRQALELDPDSGWTSGALGFMLVDRLGRAAEAEPLLLRTVQAKPDSVFYWFFYAHALELQQKPEARQAYERYLALANQIPSEHRGRLEHALAYLEASGGVPSEPSAGAALPGLSLLESGK